MDDLNQEKPERYHKPLSPGEEKELKRWRAQTAKEERIAKRWWHDSALKSSLRVLAWFALVSYGLYFYVETRNAIVLAISAAWLAVAAYQEGERRGYERGRTDKPLR